VINELPGTSMMILERMVEPQICPTDCKGTRDGQSLRTKAPVALY